MGLSVGRWLVRGAAQPDVHCVQCTSATGWPAMSLVTQSTRVWPLTSSV
jgi:hypothetical protein